MLLKIPKYVEQRLKSRICNDETENEYMTSVQAFIK